MSEPPIEDIASSPKLAAGASEDSDLEDGEIEDDDEADILIVDGNASIAKDKQQESILAYSLNKPTKVTPVVAVDLVNEAYTLSSSTKPKTQHIEDDHVSSIENAIASALEKLSIPKLLETRSDPDNEEVSAYGQSRSSRRRKCKRQRDELENERKDKKRMNMGSPEFATQTSVIANTAPAADEDDMDDYEILNVRGGSPPTASNKLTRTLLAPQKYDSQDEDSCNAYDSRISRRRKRKRQRDELENERKDKKRMNMGSPEFATQTSVIANTAPAADEDDMDDYEMLNMRGGSPPTASNTLTRTLLASQKYDSQDEDSGNSCDSYSYMPQRSYEGRLGNKYKRKSQPEDARVRQDRDKRRNRVTKIAEMDWVPENRLMGGVEGLENITEWSENAIHDIREEYQSANVKMITLHEEGNSERIIVQKLKVSNTKALGFLRTSRGQEGQNLTNAEDLTSADIV